MKTFTHSSKTGVVGAGLIGRAWAMVFARAGLKVKIFDADAKALSACMGHIETLVKDMHAADLVHENPADIVRRITPVSSLAELCTDVDLIQENITKKIKCSKYIISDIHEFPKKMKVEDILIQSSNIGAVHIARKIGEDKYKNFLNKEKEKLLLETFVDLAFSGSTSVLAECLREIEIWEGGWVSRNPLDGYFEVSADNGILELSPDLEPIK